MVLDEKCLKDCYNAPPGLRFCVENCLKNSGWSSTACKQGESTDFLAAALPTWAVLGFAAILVLLSGLFSGLTLGLLSLDPVGLRILAQAGEPSEQRFAKRIIPVRRHGNLLLCTLLFGNVVVNSAISILLSDMTSGVVGLIASTIIILIVGEIIPQSVCSRHGLMIGARSLWLVKIFMVVFFPITWPMSKFLDWILGRDIGMVYSQEELKRLIDLHYEDPEAQKESRLTSEDHKLLIGSLEYKAKRVADVMTSLENCFMLDKSTRLNFQELTAIYKSGYSRIPVYEGSRQNIQGVLYVKDLILVDPDDEIDLGTIMDLRGHGVASVFDDVTLDKVLKTFMTTYKHLLVVYKQTEGCRTEVRGTTPGVNPVVGLITLEDVIEEVLQDEIVDETDKDPSLWESARHCDNNMSTFLKFFDHKLHGANLSKQEVKAICSFLISNVEEFSIFKDIEVHLERIVARSEVVEVEASSDLDLMDMDIRKEDNLDSKDTLVLYKKNVPSNSFSLVLQGKVSIRSGVEGFTLDLGPWSHLGGKALTMTNYIPDFDAICESPSRVLRISKNHYKSSLDAVAGVAGDMHIRLPRIPSVRHASDQVKSPISSRTPLLSSCNGEVEMSPSKALARFC